MMILVNPPLSSRKISQKLFLHSHNDRLETHFEVESRRLRRWQELTLTRDGDEEVWTLKYRKDATYHVWVNLSNISAHKAWMKSGSRANQKQCNPKQRDEPYPAGFLKLKRFPKHCWRAAINRSIYVAWSRDLSERFHGETMTFWIELLYWVGWSFIAKEKPANNRCAVEAVSGCRHVGGPCPLDFDAILMLSIPLIVSPIYRSRGYRSAWSRGGDEKISRFTSAEPTMSQISKCASWTGYRSSYKYHRNTLKFHYFYRLPIPRTLECLHQTSPIVKLTPDLPLAMCEHTPYRPSHPHTHIQHQKSYGRYFHCQRLSRRVSRHDLPSCSSPNSFSLACDQ